MGAELKSFQIHYDNHYGAKRRRGWSIVYDGSVVSELESSLIVAVWKAWRRVRQWEVTQ